MKYRTTNPNKEVKTIMYQYPNGDIKYIEFKTPLQIRVKGWELVESLQHDKQEKDHDTTDDNIRRSVRRAQSTISHYCHSNDFEMFCTLTIDPKKIKNRNDLSDMMKLLSNWIELQRKKHGRFDYIFVPEVHTKGGIHFHGVLKGYKGQITKAKTRKGREVYHVSEWKHGYTDLEKIENIGKISNYIRKYITKDMTYLFGKKKYLVSKGLKLPTIHYNVEEIDIEDLEGIYDNEFCTSGYIKK